MYLLQRVQLHNGKMSKYVKLDTVEIVDNSYLLKFFKLPEFSTNIEEII